MSKISNYRQLKITALLLAGALFAPLLAADTGTEVGKSPWGPEDERGRLNLMTRESQFRILSRISSGKVYDLSVEYYIGMPGVHIAGDPPYRIWMTHTPRGNQIADPMDMGEAMNEHISYSGSAISMYTHSGTHIDALNHFGLNGKIWNGFSADQYQGDRGWTAAGAESIPPIVARGVMIDIATAKNLPQLPDNYRITESDLKEALKQQQMTLEEGDVVLVRTGRMQNYDNAAVYQENYPGLTLGAAKFLAEDAEAMIIGADNIAPEAFPSEVEGNYIPVHTYLLAQQGVPILEVVNMEALARDKVYEFAFIGGSLKLRGADAGPMRPIAIPVD
ncbi:cyclase family protein [Microbulbifer halophilus]|uniref:Cyclase family protein n=1 Tax=Microbulbifer halophilus TaxID=453963 RepID=A0ABW5EFN8_9GAMM|nr:cyclase family protein [Microbulbifer halophilus]MCW8127820.1 cyclase family protein [Microbulbifer halophilus]